MLSFYLRLGGKTVGVSAPSGRQAVIDALGQMTDEAFDALPRSEGNGRLTLSLQDVTPDCSCRRTGKKRAVCRRDGCEEA